jgi:hypothetical protein
MSNNGPGRIERFLRWWRFADYEDAKRHLGNEPFDS